MPKPYGLAASASTPPPARAMERTTLRRAVTRAWRTRIPAPRIAVPCRLPHSASSGSARKTRRDGARLSENASASSATNNGSANHCAHAAERVRLVEEQLREPLLVDPRATVRPNGEQLAVRDAGVRDESAAD